MRTWMIVIVLVVLGACKNDKDKWQKALSEVEGFYEKMCACSEQACVDDVHKQMQTWKAALDDKLGDSKPPPDFQKLLDQTHACEQTVVGKRGAVATMTKYRDMMCACKDTNCTKGVGGGGEMAKQEAANATLSDDDTKKVAQLYQEMQACMTKLTSGSGS